MYLFEQIIGQVYDYQGNRETNPITDKKTRSRRTWWADAPNQTQTGVEWIDGDGNVIHFLAGSAKKGHHVVIPNGDDYLDVGNNAELRTGGDRIEKIGGGRKILIVKDLVIEAENVSYKVRGKYQIDATEIILNQNKNSLNRLTRTIQKTTDTVYSTGDLIQSTVVTSEKVLVNTQPKRRFVLGNPLISERQKTIEDALTLIGTTQASINMTSGNISSKADYVISSDAKETVIQKGKKSIVQQTDGSHIRSAKKSITDNSPTITASAANTNCTGNLLVQGPLFANGGFGGNGAPMKCNIWITGEMHSGSAQVDNNLHTKTANVSTTLTVRGQSISGDSNNNNSQSGGHL